MEAAMAASTVIPIDTSALALRRTSRNNSPKVSDSSRTLNSTTACKPPHAFRAANSTSDNHSQANQGWPGLENEKISRVGMRPCARIHSPVRMCQPVSPSLSSDFSPCIRPNRNTIGVRKAKSARDGNSLTKNWGLDACIESGHPRAGHGLHCVQDAQLIVKGAEIHIINAQRHTRKFLGHGKARNRSLAMNTF